MEKRRVFFIITVLLVVIAGGFFVSSGMEYFLAPGLENLEARLPTGSLASTDKAQKLSSPPSPIKGIYVTSWVAGTASRISEIIKLVDETELNAVVIDVKDYSGKLSFKTDIALAEEIGAHNEIRIKDIDSLINRLHSKNIYVIGRIQVFQDPTLANARSDLAIKDKLTGGVWRDNKGIAWLDPASREVWDYSLAIAREMNDRGFDEVNLDYIRFPSDGPLETMSFPFWDEITPRYDIIRSFFEYIRQETKKDKIVLSADIFGMAAWRAMDFAYDLNIGQRMVDALPNFDVIAPMVYPSHYGAVTGYENPAFHPYEIVFTSLENTQKLIATTTGAVAEIRPWLQDFDIGKEYTAADVRAQIQATYDAGFESWLLWNASNRYTREALLEK